MNFYKNKYDYWSWIYFGHCGHNDLRYSPEEEDLEVE